MQFYRAQFTGEATPVRMVQSLIHVLGVVVLWLQACMQLCFQL